MLDAIEAQRSSDGQEEGFTLIELMVVVLIIAILLAIAIPTFLGARNTANARAAQSDLANALIAEKTIYTNGQSYSSDTVVALPAVDTGLSWTTVAPTTSGNTVGVIAGDGGNAVVLSASGKDGNCYMIQDVAVVDTTYPTAGTTYVRSAGACGAPSLTLPTPGTGTYVGTTTTAAQW